MNHILSIVGVSLFIATGPGAQEPADSPVVKATTCEIRLLVDASYDRDDVKFDLDVERGRLHNWLERDGEALIASDVSNIHLFNVRSAAAGGPANSQLRWFSRVVEPRVDDPKRWDHAYSSFGDPAIFPAYDEEQLRVGPSEQLRYLVEFFAVNMHAKGFSTDDIDPASFKAVKSGTGKSAIGFAMRGDRRTDFGNWTEKYRDRRLAMMIDGLVVSAPVLRERIEGDGAISGNFSKTMVEKLIPGLIEAAKAGAVSAMTEVLRAGQGGPLPSSADPADIRAMQSADAMVQAEKRLQELIKSGKLTGIDQILTFAEISDWLYEDGIKGMPKQLNKFDGKKVMMTGFMLPIDEVENIKEFLLVQSLWSCCYGQPPDINGIVRIVMKGKSRIDYQFEPIKIVGDFKIEATSEDGYCVDIYQLYADKVEVIR